MLGSLLALIHAHKQCLTVDKEAVAGFDQKLKDERKRADDQALYYAAIFLFYLEKLDKAREYVDRLLKINNSSKEGLILKGWIEVYSLRESPNKNAVQYFESVLKTNNRNIDKWRMYIEIGLKINNIVGMIEVVTAQTSCCLFGLKTPTRSR